MNLSRLRWVLVSCFLLLALPLAVLSYKAREQIQWEALFQQRAQAEQLTQRIDQALGELIQREDQRPALEYQFLLQAGQNQFGYLQRSPLSEWPVTNAPPGLLGYFQVDATGQLETPLLPANAEAERWGLSTADISTRTRQIAELHAILSQNQLVNRAPPEARAARQTVLEDADAESVESAPYQQNFEQIDRLQTRNAAQSSLGKVAELKLDKALPKTKAISGELAESLAQKPPERAQESKRVARKEQIAVAAPAPSMEEADAGALPATPVRLFESEVDPLQWARLDSGHLLFYRKVWRDGERLVQGFLLNESAFYEQLIGATFTSVSLAQYSNLVLAYRGDVVRIFTGQGSDHRYERLGLSSARDVKGTLILQQRLSNPFSDLQLIFSVVELPEGPGGQLISSVSVLIFVLLLIIFVLLYRVGLKQLRLARQQQDFIASVSHELKTPLTSIRMFGEMLREGWVSPDKQKEYYDFICDESERLSRLIANVLQLARMERQELQLDIKPHSLAMLADLIRSRLQSQVDRTGLTLSIAVAADAATCTLAVDADALIQILLNLVDNAIKFSRDSTQKRIELNVEHDTHSVHFKVRDFGPGIPPGQQQKIFELFYRVGNELTRETQGTGIGLALVQQLARAMTGSITVRNVQPGAEFTLTLPRIKS